METVLIALASFAAGVIVGRLSKTEILQLWDKKNGKKK